MKPIPYSNVDVEKRVIALMLRGYLIPEMGGIDDIFDADDFTDPQCREVFFDIVDAGGDERQHKALTILHPLTHYPVNPEHARYYVRILMLKAQARRLHLGDAIARIHDCISHSAARICEACSPPETK